MAEVSFDIVIKKVLDFIYFFTILYQHKRQRELLQVDGWGRSLMQFFIPDFQYSRLPISQVSECDMEFQG